MPQVPACSTTWPTGTNSSINTGRWPMARHSRGPDGTTALRTITACFSRLLQSLLWSGSNEIHDSWESDQMSRRCILSAQLADNREVRSQPSVCISKVCHLLWWQWYITLPHYSEMGPSKQHSGNAELVSFEEDANRASPKQDPATWNAEVSDAVPCPPT